MSKIPKKEVLKQLGGSATQIDQELRHFSESAKVVSVDHARLVKEHPLQWVAIYQGKLRATGKSLKSLITQLQKTKIPPQKTIIRLIDKEDRALIL